jgi:hypothetical protein
VHLPRLTTRWLFRTPRRELTLVILFSGGSLIGGLLSNRFATQTVAPSALGQFYLLMNLAAWLSVPTASAFVYICRHWAVARDSGRARQYVAWILRGLGLQAVLAVLGALVFHNLSLGGGTWIVVPVLALTCVGQAATQALAPLFGMARHRVIAGVVDLLGTPLRLAALGVTGLVVAGISGDRLFEAQSGYWVLYLVSIVSFLLWILRAAEKRSVTVSTEFGEQLGLLPLIAHATPFLITAVAAQLASSAERWGLANRANPSATAFFVQAVGLSTAAGGAATNFLATYYGPLITDAAARSSNPMRAAKGLILRYVALTCAMLGALVAAFAIGAGRITALLFGARYAGISPLLPWTVSGAALFGVAQALFMVPYAVRDSLWPNVIKVASLVIYAAVLCFFDFRGDPALTFCKFYASAQGLYLLLMFGLAVVHLKSGPDARTAPTRLDATP